MLKVNVRYLSRMGDELVIACIGGSKVINTFNVKGGGKNNVGGVTETLPQERKTEYHTFLLKSL
jgi:hypothetical protein